ncbi:MAG TPA: DUF4173 domain-containing protein [Steroidobacteraceae bacterium]|nr:DUF4173 domain-containing protein [Steroidobacteraceae bacterium]
MTALPVSRSAGLRPRGEIAELVELWAWTLPLALLGSWTCFGAVPGVNWALWTTASAAGYLAVRRRVGRSPADGYALAALALACLLSIASAITANPVADASIFVSVAALFAFCILATARRGSDIGPAALVRAPLDVCRLLLAEAAARAADTFAVVRMRDAVPVVRASAMASALAATLFLLLSAADPTLADWREVAWQTVLSRMFLARDAFFIVLSVLLLGGYGLAARKSKPMEAGRDASGNSPPAPGMRFSALERLIVLGAAMVLFLVFFAVELSNQLVQSAVHLPAGETFAEATHRGFGEMIVAAALCAMVIITLDRRASRNGRERAVRLLSWGVIAASLILVASAYLRVRYYEAAYGYTQQRLCVQVICGVVSLALLSLALEVRAVIDVPRLIRHCALIAIASVAGLSYSNSAAWIVGANVERYGTTGKVDVVYLERLARSSPDAIPALIGALPKLAPADAARVRASLQHASINRSILMPPPGTGGDLSWYEWSLRRASARSVLGAAGLLGESATR